MKKIKKTGISVCLAAALVFGALPVGAQDLTEVNPSGDMTVTANVANGDVAYLVSIPETIDLGRLTPPADNASAHLKEVEYTVSAKEITGLQKGSRVVVLMKDASGGRGFQLTGRDTANAGKTLSYSVFNGAGADISAQNRYANGYLLTGFEKAEESVTGTLKLDQNQLYGVDLSSWAGNYQGTINFFSRIASLDDYK